MNRQQRRHPSHPALPLLKPSSEKIPPKKCGGKPDSKRTNITSKKDKKGD